MDVVVIGGGPAGLAMSWCLSNQSVDHVVLERGDVANSWRTERWDSLRLLSPNWMTRLPGLGYEGLDPDGYMTAAEVTGHLETYRRRFGAPVVSHCSVDRVETVDTGFQVHSDHGPWRCRAVVDATGAGSAPSIPAIAAGLPRSMQQIVPIRYRNPDQIEPGRVLVVGASASGAQIADELARHGRPVTLAVGEHIRVPRTYRGMDIHWWMDELGVLDEGPDDVADPGRARRLPSLQLVGSPERRSLDLNALQEVGVRLVGRLVGCDALRLQLSGSLSHALKSADLKMTRLLDRIDQHASATGLAAEIGPPDRPDPLRQPEAVNELDVDSYAAVVWATGFRPHHPWLEADLLDRRGAVIHEGGVTARPGLYLLGQPFLRRRNSSFLDGIGRDASAVAEHLAHRLSDSTAAVGSPQRLQIDSKDGVPGIRTFTT